MSKALAFVGSIGAIYLEDMFLSAFSHAKLETEVKVYTFDMGSPLVSIDGFVLNGQVFRVAKRILKDGITYFLVKDAPEDLTGWTFEGTITGKETLDFTKP